MSDFRRRKNKYGLDYGWDVSVYSRPETVWGPELDAETYGIRPDQAYAEIRAMLESRCSGFTEKQFAALIGDEP